MRYAEAMIALGRGDLAAARDAVAAGLDGARRVVGRRGTPGRCCGWPCGSRPTRPSGPATGARRSRPTSRERCAELARSRRSWRPRRRPGAATRRWWPPSTPGRAGRPARGLVGGRRRLAGRRASPSRWPTRCCGWPRRTAARATGEQAAQAVRGRTPIAERIGAAPIAAEAAALARRARLSLSSHGRRGQRPRRRAARHRAGRAGPVRAHRARARGAACSRPAGPTPRSRRPCSSAPRPPACTCPTSWPSWASAAG